MCVYCLINELKQSSFIYNIDIYIYTYLYTDITVIYIYTEVCVQTAVNTKKWPKGASNPKNKKTQIIPLTTQVLYNCFVIVMPRVKKKS